MDVLRASQKSYSRWWIAAGVVAFILVTLGFTRLKAAAPKVERAGLWLGTVQRGEMLREVRGAGSLVPEEIRWITTVVSARVDRIVLRAGASVDAKTVILQLSNPDLELTALEAEQQLATARADLVRLEADQNSLTLSQRSNVATLSAEQRDASRRAQADEALAKKGLLSRLELQQSTGRAEELAGRIQFENERLVSLGRGKHAQLQAQRAQVGRLAAIAVLRRQQVAELCVVALCDGVVQEVGVQVGQWVGPGTVLAKVAQPTRLKAEVRVSEVLAKDVVIGQHATVDTRNGFVNGKVSRIDPAVTAGTVTVDIVFDEPLPAGARPDQSVEGIIELERLPDVLYVDRPANAKAHTTLTLFRVEGDHASRVTSSFGRVSAKTVEVTGGLNVGDQIILSDMSSWQQHDILQVK